jgi:hypothetical protein
MALVAAAAVSTQRLPVLVVEVRQEMAHQQFIQMAQQV